MKVYVVRVGMENQECTPSIAKIFFKQEDAETYILNGIEEQRKMYEERKWLIKIERLAENYWLTHIRFPDDDISPEQWYVDDAWLIDEIEVE